MNLTAHGRTDRGLVRNENQDYFAILPESRFFAVADGMGGHFHGGRAAKIAIQCQSGIIQAAGAEERSSPLQAEALLIMALNAANVAIRDELDGFGMISGTTATSLIVGDSWLVWANVGDSRLYRITDGRAIQLTSDHNLATQLVLSGQMTLDQAKSSPHSHRLTRALGARPDVDIDIGTAKLNQTDSVMLCTDGLYRVVNDVTMANIVTGPGSITSRVDGLIDLALKKGGPDNISVVLIELDKPKETLIKPARTLIREIDL